MKNFFISVIALCLLIFFQCSNNYKQATQDVTGTYLWKYPAEYATSLNQDNRIVIHKNDNIFKGTFYGTTDEFDKAREGYLPGFFVLNIEDLYIEGDTIRFNLRPEIDDFFNEYIDSSIKSSEDAMKKGYTHWTNFDHFPFITLKRYEGLFLDSATIYFEKDFENGNSEKRFIKIDSN